jgi:hypothetical protein
MKRVSYYWLISGVSLGTVFGIILQNIPAGICLGLAIGCLTMLLSFTSIEK